MSNHYTPKFPAGTRVKITQPKVYGTGPSATETTEHYGVTTGAALQPSDDRLAVRIDSGAVILYPGAHVTESDKPLPGVVAALSLDYDHEAEPEVWPV